MEGTSDIQSVLTAMRTLQQQATQMAPVDRFEGLGSPGLGSPGLGRAEGSNPASFGSHLKNALDEVNSVQKSASTLADGFVRGDHQDLVSTMVAAQKSSVAFQATLATLNRLVSAYQDIMNMPI